MRAETGPPDVAVPGRFAVVRELGAGGMGTVYEAHDRELDITVALKLLHEGGGEAIEKLKHEFRVAADVRHDNLVRLGELFEHAHRWCFSMELVDGVDLVSHVARRGKPRPRRDAATAPIGETTTGERGWDGETPSELDFDDGKLRRALAQLADGLAALHAAGIVHRDVKPTNIRVRPDGRLVLLDLGLATTAGDLRDGHLMMGTAEYMSPEQVEGASVETAADLYAMGAVLYEALVGRPPHVGPIAQLLAEKMSFDPLPPAVLFPEVPVDLDRLCMALLARDPARRPTAAAVAAQLHAEDPGSRGAGAGTAPIRTARGFVGRAGELAALLDGNHAATAAPTVRVVAGPSGIGKTRLLSRFAQASRDRAALVCFGRCRVREHVRLNAWEPLLDGLTRFLGGLPRAERDALLPPDAEAISRLFPIFARVLPVASTSSAPAGELERRALVALRALLGRVAGDLPVVLVIDDVQWATADSMALLARLIEAPGAPPLALVLGLRTSEQESGAGLDRLGVAPTRIELGPLDAADARELARILVSDPDRAEKIAAEAGGHPLFLEVMASSTSTSDVLHKTLRRRIEELPGELRELLGVLAAAAGPLRLDVLGAVLGRDAFAIADGLRGLVHQRLVSLTGVRRTDHAEPFHALVTESVLALAAPEALRADHRRIARALEAMPHVQPERRALHWAWAGEADRAAAEALALVAAARHALAYSRAADACEVVLGTALAGPRRRELERAYADALAGSGLAMRAAVAYRDAATSASGDDRLDLERRAAENFLRCAAIEDGMALFGRVCEQLGYPAAMSPTRTIAALLVERARLRLRGTAPRRGAIDPALAARSDACYSLSTGLAMLDAISGALFQTRSTRFALDAGDPARAARALAVEACFVAAWGSPTRVRSGRIIAEAERLAAEVGEPTLIAFAQVGRGVCALQWGDFDDAVTHCDAALAVFREKCAGVAWEERTGEVFSIWAHAWRGDWGEVGRRADALARAGAATGERYASMHAAIGPSIYGWLAADEPETARARVAEVMHGWPRGKLDLPLLRELVALANIGVYQRRGAEVLALLRASWRDLERSRMLGLEPVLGTLGDLRVRAALLAGEWDDARVWIRRLEKVPWATGIATLGKAALAAQRGDAELAVAELERAEREARATRIELYAAAARDRRGRLIGGDEGRRLIDDAAAAARAREIARPEHLFATLAPWPGE